MSTVGFIVHQDRPEAADAARSLSEWLTSAEHQVRMPPAEAAETGCGQFEVPEADFANGLDLVVTVGGDGSILRAVELIGTSGVPVLGVDFGRLGYLSEVQPADALAAVQKALAGGCQIEERLLLAITTTGTTTQTAADNTFYALNEAFVERGAASNTIRLITHVDDDEFTTYSADGLIVATPTGSTAYAFSARGPIIDPTHQAILLTPVSPHMLFDRSLVTSADVRLRIVVDGDRPGVLSVDGKRVAELSAGDAVQCHRAPQPVRFVTFGERTFHRVLRAKFGLNGPLTP